MNNNKMKFLVAAGAMCVAGFLVADPGAGAPPRDGKPQHQKVAQSHGGRPAAKSGAHPGGGHANVAKAKPHTPAPAAKPHHPPAVKHHSRPANARHWARPAPPPRHHGAKRAWEWITAAWEVTVGGVCYYGDGYYYDGYNYYYNGAYYTTPPVVVTQTVVTQPVVAQPVVTQPVVTQPVVAQPVVVTPAPPPPPPRRRGLLEWLFGD